MAGSDGLHMCVDRVIPDRYAPARATMSRAFATRALSADDVVVTRMALPVTKMWEPGTQLKVRFLDGSAKQRKLVKNVAHEWEAFASITFRFVTTTDEQIRISFEADEGSWSALGNDALIEAYFPRYQPTMNFGWIKDDTDKTEVSRVVLHEFGHALGCIHEHQTPAAGLKWNEAEVLRVFSGAPNFWTKDEIIHNVLGKYDKKNMNFTKFDPDSIMLYSFPANLFLKGEGTSANTELSEQDKKFIARMYPKASNV